MSEAGATLIGDAAIPPGTALSFTIPGSPVTGRGIVRHVRSLETSLAVLFSIGVAFDEPKRRSLPWRSRLSRGAAAVPLIAQPETEERTALLS
jgi:hypothetical protein